jgi:hypothetical protein
MFPDMNKDKMNRETGNNAERQLVSHPQSPYPKTSGNLVNALNPPHKKFDPQSIKNFDDQIYHGFSNASLSCLDVQYKSLTTISLIIGIFLLTLTKENIVSYVLSWSPYHFEHLEISPHLSFKSFLQKFDILQSVTTMMIGNVALCVGWLGWTMQLLCIYDKS